MAKHAKHAAPPRRRHSAQKHASHKGVTHCLWIEGKTKPKEIAAELKLENSTISGVLERMEKKELIERQVSKEDRRFIEVVLTEKGKALQNPILATVEEVNKDVLSEMSQEEQSELKKALRILGGLEDE